MEPMYYIGLDVHKRKISYCVKDSVAKSMRKDRWPPGAWTWNRWMKTACRSRGARRWKRPCSRAGFTITSSRMLPL